MVIVMGVRMTVASGVSLYGSRGRVQGRVRVQVRVRDVGLGVGVVIGVGSG